MPPVSVSGRLGARRRFYILAGLVLEDVYRRTDSHAAWLWACRSYAKAVKK